MPRLAPAVCFSVIGGYPFPNVVDFSLFVCQNDSTAYQLNNNNNWKSSNFISRKIQKRFFFSSLRLSNSSRRVETETRIHRLLNSHLFTQSACQFCNSQQIRNEFRIYKLLQQKSDYILPKNEIYGKKGNRIWYNNGDEERWSITTNTSNQQQRRQNRSNWGNGRTCLTLRQSWCGWCSCLSSFLFLSESLLFLSILLPVHCSPDLYSYCHCQWHMQSTIRYRYMFFSYFGTSESWLTTAVAGTVCYSTR